MPKFKYTTERIKKLSKNAGIEFISKKYKGICKIHKWRCACGTVFNRAFNNLLYRKSYGCRKCLNKRRKRHIKSKSLKDYIFLAEQRGGEILFSTPPRVNVKDKYKCKEGHIFFINYSNAIKGHWCTYCNQSRGELFSRHIIEMFTGIKLSKERPEWLKNPKTNRRLELDGLNEEHRIAFEYNGPRHKEQKIIEKDIYKQKVLKELNYKFIVINEFTHLEPSRLELEIINQLNLLDIKYEKTKIDLKTCYVLGPNESVKRFEILNNLCKETNRECLETLYLGSRSLYRIHCKNCNTTRKCSYDNLVNKKYSCKTCSYNSPSRERYTVTDITNLLRNKNLKCIEIARHKRKLILHCLACDNKFTRDFPTLIRKLRMVESYVTKCTNCFIK